jgi:heme exporter protein B
MSTVAGISAVLRRDLRIAFRRWGDLLSPLMFFAMVTVLFPLALAPQREIMLTLGPAVLWIAALLATVMSMPSLFRADVEDGSMDQLAVSAHPLPVLILSKTLAHWLINGLPLVALAPLMAITYYLPEPGVRALCLTLLLGTPTLSLLGSIGAALTASVRQSGGLLALLVLPLMLPVLMFGARGTAMAAAGESISGALYLLGAFLVLALTLAPFASAAAIRISLD